MTSTHRTVQTYVERGLGRLSPRAKQWSTLLAAFQFDYPVPETVDTGVDRLLNHGITDGEQALQLVYATLAADTPNYLKRTIEQTLRIGGERGVKVLRACSENPHPMVRELSQEVLKAYESGQLKPDKFHAFQGTDKQAEARLKKEVDDVTSHWTD